MGDGEESVELKDTATKWSRGVVSHLRDMSRACGILLLSILETHNKEEIRTSYMAPNIQP